MSDGVSFGTIRRRYVMAGKFTKDADRVDRDFLLSVADRFYEDWNRSCGHHFLLKNDPACFKTEALPLKPRLLSLGMEEIFPCLHNLCSPLFTTRLQAATYFLVGNKPERHVGCLAGIAVLRLK